MQKIKTLKLYWAGRTQYRKGPKHNFGDIISPLLFNHFNIPFQEVAAPNEANILCIGSIAQRARSKTIILGSGIIRGKIKLKKDCEWRLVRGPRTRAAVIANGGQCTERYGDPALLLPLICEPAEKKEYKIGYIPHYSEIRLFKKKYNQLIKDRNNLLINVKNNNPLKVAKAITKCEYIVSSSLHGIIAAHAYGIPAAWFDLGEIDGDGTKFHDYYESVNLKAQLSTVDNPKYSCFRKDKTAPIIEAFQEIKERLEL